MTDTAEQTALQTSFVDPDISTAMALYKRMEPLRDALGLKDLTDQEIQLFAMVALHKGLDPFAREIYAQKRAGKVVYITGIDGYRVKAQETGEYRGSSEPEFGPWVEKPYGHPEWARVTVSRADKATGEITEQSATAWWDEYVPAEDFMWKKMPRNQLAKCAEALALRKKFPRQLEGLYVAEEMEQSRVIEGEATEVKPPPAVRDRIAARRAASEAAANAPAAATPTASPEAAAGTPAGSDGPAAAVAVCGDEDASPMALGFCVQPPDHKDAHRSASGDTWPRPR